MVLESKLETVLLSSLIDNSISTKWFDYTKPSDYLKKETITDGTVRVFKHPYISQKGADPEYPNHHLILNGKAIIDLVRENGTETSIKCFEVPDVSPTNITYIINALNTERNLKQWEKCEKALTFLPPKQQGKSLGNKTRWSIAIEEAGVDISDDTLERYYSVKCYDQETNQEFQLINRIKGIGITGEQRPLELKDARAFVSRQQNKKKLKEKYPDKKIIVDEEIYTDLIQDFDVWQQDNRQPWLIADESIQLICCSPHYFNQRKYTEDGIEYEAQTLPEYLNDLLLAFTQGKKKLKKDGVLSINIADTHKHGENYIVILRFCIDLADKLGLYFMFKQIWCKSNGLAKGREERTPVYDYEEILYFSKSKDYYFEPLKYYDLEKEITLAYYNGRTNPDGSSTLGKWIVSKEYETFNQFIQQTVFEDIIITSTASSESKAIKEKYGEKHPAVMPLVIPLYPILCFTKPGDIVYDPWAGTGTTLKVALATGRKARGTDLEERFVNISKQELQEIKSLFITE